MAKKLDKEMFLKHHFWYLMGILVPLIFLAILLLWTGTASAIGEQQKKFDDKKKELEALGSQQPKNPKWIEVLDQKAVQADQQQQKLWKEMWDKQADLTTWPSGLQKYKDLPFGSKIDLSDRIIFTKDDQYLAQIPEIIQLVNPVDRNGQGTVQALGDDWAKILRYKLSWNNQTPSAENVWLAQEDLWVKRELLRVVRDANNAAASFEKLANPPKPDKSKNEFDRQVFTSPIWKMEIALASREAKPYLRYRLTNVSRRRQPLEISFLLTFRGTHVQDAFFVDDEPLAPNASVEKEQPLSFQAQLAVPQGIETVSEILDWRTAAVKRVDKLEVAFHCPRTAPRGLFEHPFPQLKGDPSQGVTTDEGFARKRYCELTPQVRRLPVAMLLITDQSGIQDVLTAFANSKLQLQTTMWHWQRYHSNIKPQALMKLASAKAPPRSSAVPSAPQAPPPESEDEGEITGRRVRRRPPSTPAAAAAAAPPSGAATDQEFELVELAVYGIANLYERPPFVPVAAATPPAAAAPPATKAEPPKPAAPPAPTPPPHP